MRIPLWLIVGVVVTLGAAGCAKNGGEVGDAASSSSGPPRSSPTTTVDTTTLAPTTTIAAPPAPDWQPCSRTVECATVTVPLDYTDPSGPMVDLALARRPADDPSQRVGTLFVNPGGPGVSGVDLVRGGGGVPRDLRQRFDIVSWDPRGVGQSRPLACGSSDAAYQAADPTPDDPLEAADLEQLARAVADECASTDGDLLPFVGSDNTVQDLDLIRRAMGEEQLNYFGFSYGTLLGALYLDRYPAHVRAMVLDGVVDPAADLSATAEGQAVGLESALNAIFASCSTTASCSLTDPPATFDDVSAALESEAGPDNPGPATLVLATYRASYDADLWPSFLAALAAAETGDFSDLEQLAGSYSSLTPFSTYAAVACLDLPHPDSFAGFDDLADDLEALAPRLGRAVAFELLPCAFWATDPTRDPAPVSGEGAPPVLVVGNTGDAATPLDNASRVAAGLAGSRLLVLQGEGHLSTGDPCVDQWTTSYLLTLALPPEGATC